MRSASSLGDYATFNEEEGEIAMFRWLPGWDTGMTIALIRLPKDMKQVERVDFSCGPLRRTTAPYCSNGPCYLVFMASVLELFFFFG